MTTTNNNNEPDNNAAKFVEQMIKDGFVWMSSEKFTQTRLYNKFSGKSPANDFVPLAYARYCKLKKVDETDNISAYVKASLPLVTGTIFRPNAPEIVYEYGSNWINTYRQRERQKSHCDIKLFHEYLERLWPDDSDRNTCVSWLAHMFQKPEERPSWHIMLISEVGTGKGFLVTAILNELLCKQSAVINSYEQVTGKFSTLLAQNMLVLLDDPKTKSDHTMTRLKSILSEERAFVERKGLEGAMIETYTRFILASNESRPLRLDEDERRWFVPKRLEHKKDKAETQQFIEALAKALETPGYLDTIYGWFMELDISNINHKHVPQSTTLQEMIGLSRNVLDDVLEDFFEESRVFTWEAVKNFITSENYALPTDAALKNTLFEKKCRKAPLTISGVKQRYWINGDLTNEEARQILTDKALIQKSQIPARHPF